MKRRRFYKNMTARPDRSGGGQGREVKKDDYSVEIISEQMSTML